MASKDLSSRSKASRAALSKAFTFLFDNYDSSQKSSSVVLTSENGERVSGKSTLILNSPFVDGSDEEHILVTSTAGVEETCHACSAAIAVYVFVKNSDVRNLKTADKEVGRFGSWGSAGKAKVVNFAPSVPGFSLISEDGGQGESDASEVLFAPVKGHFQAVLSLETESDNAGNCVATSTDDEAISHTPCYRNDSVIRFLKSTHNGYFDIAVDESGTKSTDAGIVAVDGKKVYLFSGEKYLE
jgi:hypothetical protein